MEIVLAEQIDTAEVPAELRTDRWQEFTARTMVHLSCSTLDPSGIVGRQVNVRRPEHTSILIEGHPHLIQRTADNVATSPTDMVQLSFIDQGELYFQDSTGMRIARRGDVLMFDTDQPYAMSIPHDVVMRSVHVNRSLLDSGPGVERPAGILSSVSMRTSTSELRQAHQLVSEFLDDEFTAASRGTIDVMPLVRTLYGSTTVPTESSSPWWNIVLREARTRLRDSGLRARHVAVAIPLSERQLSRVLADHGLTWHELVLRERLELLRGDLLAAHAQQRAVGEIIMDCGFSSPAHAHRQFRKLTGTTPGAYRAEHAAGAGGRSHRE